MKISKGNEKKCKRNSFNTLGVWRNYNEDYGIELNCLGMGNDIDIISKGY